MMASSSSVMTSPMTNTISYIGVSTMDDDVTYRVAATAPKHEACNGLVRNASFSTITVSSPCSLPHSLSAQNVKRSVSTVFSSNHRRSWQLSLSNYSQDTTRKDLTTSAQTPEAHELLAVRQAPEGSSGLCCGSSGGLDKRQSQSVIVVYPEDHVVQSFVHEVAPKPVPSVRVIADSDQDLGSECLGVDCGSGGEISSCRAGNVEGKSGSGYEACCGVGESGPGCSSVSSGEGCPENVLAWSSHQEPQFLRHQTHHHHHHHHRSHSSPSGCIGGRGDSIEMSLYQINYPATHPTNIHTDNRQGTDATIHQHGGQSHAALQSHSQSVSVLRTTDHSDAVSPSTHGNRKDSERTVRYSSDSDHIEERPKCRLQLRDYESDKQIDDTTTSSSDCPPDTQPLLPLPRVRVEGVSSSDSPEMCAENTLLRFHSLDSKDSGSKETERTPTMQRAVSINSPHNIAALTSDSSRLLVGAAGGPPARGGSPTGSDSLAAPALNELYRYHVFLSHCAQDVAWAEEVVARLQAPPYCYQCVYTPLLAEHDPNTLEQKLLCSAMLSERVVLVLSKQYVQETWFVFEKVLRQLTQMSLHNQRIMGVLLEDCEIPDTLGELYFLDTSDPDFFEVFTKRLKTGRIPRSSESVSSDLAGKNSIAIPSVVNGQTLAQCSLSIRPGWHSYLQMSNSSDELPPCLKTHGINLERPEYYAIVHNVSCVLQGSNRLPWVMCIQPLLALLLVGAIWLPAFITVLALQMDDNSGFTFLVAVLTIQMEDGRDIAVALPVRLMVFVFPLVIVCCGYLLKWRRRYWLSKMVRMLVQNCIKANQLLYCEGRPVLTTAAQLNATNFIIYFIYFDLTDCVRSVDLLLFSCLEDDWDKLMKLVQFYARDKNYLSQVSMSERLTVMVGAAYLFKMVRHLLPHPPQQRHMNGQLCLCQFTEECVTRFVHGLDREDLGALVDLFKRHLYGYVSGSTVRRISTQLFHRLQ